MNKFGVGGFPQNDSIKLPYVPSLNESMSVVDLDNTLDIFLRATTLQIIVKAVFTKCLPQCNDQTAAGLCIIARAPGNAQIYPHVWLTSYALKLRKRARSSLNDCLFLLYNIPFLLSPRLPSDVIVYNQWLHILHIYTTQICVEE